MRRGFMDGFGSMGIAMLNLQYLKKKKRSWLMYDEANAWERLITTPPMGVNRCRRVY